MNQPNPQAANPPDPRRWPALFFLLLASFMNMIDVTIVNVALPEMQTDLGANSSQIEWVVAGYVLAFALFLLPFGRLGDIIGRRAMFLWGVVAFTIGSLLCGIAPSIETLIAARVAQGIAGAMMTPQVLSIATVLFPPKERGFAFSFFGLTAGLASVAGPMAGGLLISADLWGLDWRPIFLINIPIGIIAVLAALRYVPKVEPHPGLKNDFVGIAIFGAAILAIVFPLVEGRIYGWPLWAFGLIVAGILGLVGFYFWERRREKQGLSELLPVALLANRNFAVGTLMTLVFFSGVPGLFMVLAIFFQTGFGFTPLQSGLATIAFPIGVLVASQFNGRLANRWLSRRLFVGALLLTIGMTMIHMVITGIGETIDAWAFVPGLLIGGLGMSTAISALFQTILQGVPHKDAGSASGSLQAFQQVGGALGVALVGEIFFSTLEKGGAASMQAGFVNAAGNATWYQIAAFAVVALMVPLLNGHRPRCQCSPRRWRREPSPCAPSTVLRTVPPPRKRVRISWGTIPQ